MNTPETFETIRQWANDTFGTATVDRTIERAREEFDELMEPDADKLEEAADVVITLCNLPGLAAAVERKMAKNRRRTWNVRGDGTGYHIDPPAPNLSELPQWEREGWCGPSCTNICGAPCYPTGEGC